MYWVGDGYHDATNSMSRDRQIHQQLGSCGQVLNGMDPKDGMSTLSGTAFSRYDRTTAIRMPTSSQLLVLEFRLVLEE